MPKKASGSYYTSDAIVRTIVKNALDPLCERKTFDDILRLKVLDPAMGSGHFLVGVIDYLALQLAKHYDAPSMTTGGPRHRNRILAQTRCRNVYLWCG